MKQRSEDMFEFDSGRIGAAFVFFGTAASFLLFFCLQAIARDDSQTAANISASPKSEYAMINGIRIHYLEWGSKGPTIILLHGMNDDAGIWKKLAPILASDYHIVAPDRRGSGDSDKPVEGYDFQTLINDIALLAEQLKLAPVTVIGHSFGAEVALNLAAQKPGLIRSVVLVEGGFWPKRAAALEPPALPIEKTSSDYDPETLYSKVNSPVLLVVARGAGPGAEAIAELKKQGIDYFEEVKKSQQRVKDAAENKLRKGQITYIENTSHWIQKDQPQSLAQAIKRYLASK
jgi:pimeloyl-ACP methyl ester carboxylesterase